MLARVADEFDRQSGERGRPKLLVRKAGCDDDARCHYALAIVERQTEQIAVHLKSKCFSFVEMGDCAVLKPLPIAHELFERDGIDEADRLLIRIV